MCVILLTDYEHLKGIRKLLSCKSSLGKGPFSYNPHYDNDTQSSQDQGTPSCMFPYFHKEHSQPFS